MRLAAIITLLCLASTSFSEDVWRSARATSPVVMQRSVWSPALNVWAMVKPAAEKPRVCNCDGPDTCTCGATCTCAACKVKEAKYVWEVKGGFAYLWKDDTCIAMDHLSWSGPMVAGAYGTPYTGKQATSPLRQRSEVMVEVVQQEDC